MQQEGSWCPLGCIRETTANGRSRDRRGVGRALDTPAMESRRVAWLQRGLLVGVGASVLAVAAGSSASHATSTTLALVLWFFVVVNALPLLALGPIALVTSRTWFRRGLPVSELRPQRRAVRRRAVFLGLIAYVAHQTLVVLLDPKFSLERLTGGRRILGPVVAVPGRVELAWALSVLALAYIVLAWLLWRSARVPDLSPSEAGPEGSWSLVEGAPPEVFAPPSEGVEVLPRDPATGRVVRQFDL